MSSSAVEEPLQVGNGLPAAPVPMQAAQESPMENRPRGATSTVTDPKDKSRQPDYDRMKESAPSKDLPVCPVGPYPSALSVRLVAVQGSYRLPDGELQEVLRGKLRILEADSTGVVALFSELSAQLLSISSEEDTMFITFKSYEDVRRFQTYYTIGLLDHCMENLLLDPEFWLRPLEQEYAGIDVRVHDEQLVLLYRETVMRDGSFFGRCTASQMFESSTSAGDVYLEPGDVAVFEPPPVTESVWTVESLLDGSRGTKSRPAMEPLIPFHQWFLKSCSENILVGSEKGTRGILCHSAVGSCVATSRSQLTGSGELAFERGDTIHVVGMLEPCFRWFLGRHEGSGGIGLVKTKLVAPAESLRESKDIFLERENSFLFDLKEENAEAESIALLSQDSQSDVSTTYKLDVIRVPGPSETTFQTAQFGEEIALDCENLRTTTEMILGPLKARESSQVPHEDTHKYEAKEDEEDQDQHEDEEPLCFTVLATDNVLEKFLPLLSFLNPQDYHPQFLGLYHFSLKFLRSFRGQSSEEKLMDHLSSAREMARKRRMFWAQSRLCFLLGKLCARKSKFSQARVYLEEALSVPRDEFVDIRLLTAIYANLAVVYLTQRNTEKYMDSCERVAALRWGVADHVCSTERETDVLRYALKNAILAGNSLAEARGCFLLAQLYCTLGENQSALPFVERLQVLMQELPVAGKPPFIRGFLALGRLYRDSELPHLAVSCAKRSALHPSASLLDCLSGIHFVLEKTPVLAPYLRRVLELTEGSAEHAVRHAASVCLSQLLQEHGLLSDALQCMRALLGGEVAMSPVDATAALLSVAWMYVQNQQLQHALEVLDALLATSPHVQGIAHNMRGIALRRMGDVKRASASFQVALKLCEGLGSQHNQAVALANLGVLYWQVQAEPRGERCLLHSAELFSQLDDEGHEANFVSVLLELGLFYSSPGRAELEKAKIYYEWALLIALSSGQLQCQLRVCRSLCLFYRISCPDVVQSIIYNKHLLKLLRETGDSSQEAGILETISELYLSLGTDRAYRAALEYTKRSLGLCIDLRRKDKEALAWLQAGKIYHILGQDELVDLYVQVAQDSSLITGNTPFILDLLEMAGDLFFNGSRDRHKAVFFYRDRALPIAVRTCNARVRLRLCNKLSQVLMHMQLYKEAAEFAQASLELSVATGEHLNERVAFHRLGTLYHQLGQFELAEHHYLKALALCPSPLQFDEETLYYVRVYFTLGDITFYDLKDPFDAAGYYHLALAAAMDLGNKRAQLQLCTRLATVYHNFLVDRELSLFFYQAARGFATQLNVRRINLSAEQHFSSRSRYRVGAP